MDDKKEILIFVDEKGFVTTNSEDEAVFFDWIKSDPRFTDNTISNAAEDEQDHSSDHETSRGQEPVAVSSGSKHANIHFDGTRKLPQQSSSTLFFLNPENKNKFYTMPTLKDFSNQGKEQHQQHTSQCEPTASHYEPSTLFVQEKENIIPTHVDFPNERREQQHQPCTLQIKPPMSHD